jgi:hypothetical protein
MGSAGRSLRRLGSACVIVAVLGVIPLVWAPGAMAEISFCPSGSGAGQCGSSVGVATDLETGRVYVVDRGNSRVNVFEVDGKFVMAFGWGVKTGAAEAQTCGPAVPELEPDPSLCQAGIPGSGAGQLEGPRAIAVDNDSTSPAQHDVYVITADQRAQRFAPDGHFRLGFGWGVRDGLEKEETCGPEAGPPSATCQTGLGGDGKCQLARGFFDSVAVGPGGAVYVADTAGSEPNHKGRIEKFEPSGACVEETILFEAQNHLITSLAVDSGGDVYAFIERVFEGKGEVIRKYPPASNAPLCEIDGTNTIALAVDPSDNLFAAQREQKAKPPGGFAMITQYASSCNRLRRFAYVPNDLGARGIAAFPSAEGQIFASEGGGEVHYIALPPPGPVVVEPSVEAPSANVSNTKATLYAEVNPEGTMPTKYHFEYIDQQSFETEGGFASPNTKSTVEVVVPIKPGTPEEEKKELFKLHAAEALIGCKDPVKEASEGKCLTPETTYRFRIIAENADGEGNSPIEGAPFTTKKPIEFGEAWSTAVGVETAQLHTEVNPLGIPATGYFEYVDDATFQKDVEELGEGHGFDHATQTPNVSGGATPLDLGSGEALTAQGATLFPLSQGTTYHYRLIAEDPLIEPVSGPEGIFRTFAKAKPELCPANEAFRTGPSALLPDCRAYEMVTPLEKNNGDIYVLNETFSGLPAALNQSSTSIPGSKLTYGTYRAFGDAKSAPFTSQYIAARDAAAEEWLSHGISPLRSRPIFGVLASADTEFKAFSPDLCEAWLRTVSEPLLAPGGLKGFPNIYRTQDEECGGPSYEALTTAEWQNFGPGKEPTARQELQGVSANGDKAIFIAPDSLEGSGAPNIGPDQPQLYIWAGGPLPVFACILPNGEAKAPCSGGMNSTLGTGKSRSANVQGAISGDGTRVFWTASGGGPGKIYLREHAEQGQVGSECSEAGIACTIAVSKAAEELSGTSASQFFAAAGDGSKVIFATVKDLEPPKEDIEDLYEFHVDSETTTLIAHHVLPDLAKSSILGASEDLSHIYFASTDVMGGANSEGDVAQTGKPNLYLDEEGSIRFVGTLSNADVTNGTFTLSPIEREPKGHTARVTPNGEHAAFMSAAPLTGFDNTDAKNGEADAEVFLYDAAANEGQGELICASCNPSGARPTGANLRDQSSPFWAAAQIPVFENTLHAARALSDDGARLYFESSDTLAARDTNSRRDVYQWEALDSGGCDEGDAAFSAQAEGCIDLISSGQSSKDSEFIEASPNGNDIFLATLSSLLPQDYGLVDIYDARVGGGFKSPPPRKVPCEGEACQSPPAPPVPPTPATATGGPAQTLPPEPSCAKGKHAVKRKGKTRCVSKKPGKAKGRHKRRGKRSEKR